MGVHSKLITITLSEGCNCCGALTLADSNFTPASPGSMITWEISPNSEHIQWINAITACAGNKGQNIFEGGTEPHDISEAKDGTKWRGVIANSLTKGDFESYSIAWEDNQNQPQTYDPKIKIDPST